MSMFADRMLKILLAMWVAVGVGMLAGTGVYYCGASDSTIMRTDCVVGLVAFGLSLWRLFGMPTSLVERLKRLLPTWKHEWEPVEMHAQSTWNGEIVGRSVRRTKICVRCGHTEVFSYMPCRRVTKAKPR